jgi:hypothetical protein
MQFIKEHQHQKQQVETTPFTSEVRLGKHSKEEPQQHCLSGGIHVDEE